MKNYIKKLGLINIVFLLSLLTTLTLSTAPVNAKLRDLESTRLISTSGAGIGSVLLNEAAFLNPASIYFFQQSSLYYQQGSSKMKEASAERESDYKDGENQTFLITDTSSALKGAFSYQTQSEDGDSRKRFTSSASSNWGKNMSVGVLYRYTEEDAQDHEVYHQGVLGITYIHSKQLTFGAILVDPFLANKEDALLGGGLQYTLTQNFIVIADAGANYNDDPEDNKFWRAAAQAQFFKSFYLKYGRFEDDITKLRGYSYGVSWVGPKLAVEYAYRNSEARQDTEFYFNGEQLEDHSVALSVVF